MHLERLESAALAVIDRINSSGVLHNDIKPANFLLGGPRGVMAVDFAFSEISSKWTERMCVQEMFERKVVNRPGANSPRGSICQWGLKSQRGVTSQRVVNLPRYIPPRAVTTRLLGGRGI